MFSSVDSWSSWIRGETRVLRNKGVLRRMKVKAATMLLLTTSARALRPAARRLRYRRFHYQSGGKSSAASSAAAAVGCFAASAAYALGDEAEDGAWAGVLDTATTGAA